MSTEIHGPESSLIIDDAFSGMNHPRNQRKLLRRDSTGPERVHFDRVSAIDNNYSYTNTAVRNDEYVLYDPIDIDVWSGPEYATSYNWERRR